MKILHMTVYSHDLNEYHKSFNTDLTIEDFKPWLKGRMLNARRVTYMNPKMESFIIREKKDKKGIYDEEE